MALGTKDLRGMAWTGGEKILVAVLGFVQSVILARLLTPHDFGLAAMLSIFLGLGAVLAESGLGRALIAFASQGLDARLERKALVWNLSVACGLYGLLVLFSPKIADFYHEPILIPLMGALGSLLPLEAASVVAVACLQRAERFATLTRINAGTTLFGSCVGIACAAFGCGVWSIVAMSISWALSRLLLLLVVSPAHSAGSVPTSLPGSVPTSLPGSVPISAGSVPTGLPGPVPISAGSVPFVRLLRYGIKLAISAFIHSLYGNIFHLLIGKLVNPTTVGLYKRAERWALLPGDIVNESVGRVGFVRMARTPVAGLALGRGIGRACLLLNLAVLWPALIVLGIFAPQIVGGVLGRDWLDCVPYLRILLCAAACVPVTRVAQNILQARGAANRVLVGDAIKVPFWIVFLVLGSRTGVEGLCWAYVAGCALEAAVDAALVVFRVKNSTH